MSLIIDNIIFNSDETKTIHREQIIVNQIESHADRLYVESWLLRHSEFADQLVIINVLKLGILNVKFAM